MKVLIQYENTKDELARRSYEKMRKAGITNDRDWEDVPSTSRDVHQTAVNLILETLTEDLKVTIAFEADPPAAKASEPVNTEEAPASAPAPATATSPPRSVYCSTDEICRMVYRTLNVGVPGTPSYESMPAKVKESGVQFADAVLKALETMDVIRLEQPAPAIKPTEQAPPPGVATPPEQEKKKCGCAFCTLFRKLDKNGATPEQSKALASDLLLLMLTSPMPAEMSKPTKLN